MFLILIMGPLKLFDVYNFLTYLLDKKIILNEKRTSLLKNGVECETHVESFVITLLTFNRKRVSETYNRSVEN